MAYDLNHCAFIGRLGRDPEIRFLPAGDAVANFQIAVGKTWTDKSGEKKEQTTWVPVTAFGKLAEIVGEYLKKGAQVYVSGEFHVRKYTDKEGNERWATEVRADKLQMLGKKDGKPEESSAAEYGKASGGREKPKQAATAGGFDDLEDVPF